MGATFSRLKNWVAEVLTYADLNAEIDNILNNLGPSGVDDYSTNSTQMRTTTDPGEVGSESLATSLAGELERLRYAIKEMKGGDVDYWYETATTSLSDLNSAIGGGFPENRISSGITTGESSQLRALIPSGSTTSVTLKGAATNFVYYIQNTQYSVTADITVTGLSAAPSSNATAAILDAQAGDNQFTEFMGEYGTQINIGSAGSEIANRVGQFAGFMLNNGSTTEYFTAYIQSTSALTKAMRGAFWNSSTAAVTKLKYTNGDSVTLLRLAWIFATTSSSMAVTYTTPTYAASEPSAPSSGDYWYDMVNNKWKIFNSTSWVDANATLIGMSMQSSAACVAARTFDNYVAISDSSTVELEWLSNSVVQAKFPFSSVHVFGTELNFGMRRPTWDIAANLESGLVEAASTYYYLYIKENGAPVVSDKVPLDLRGSRGGLYHPHQTWRCVGCVFNNASSNFDPYTVYTFRPRPDYDRMVAPTMPTGYSINSTVSSNALTIQVRDAIGNYPSELVPTRIPIRNATAAAINVTYGEKILTSMPQITVSNGSTLGHGNNRNAPILMYLLDSGTSMDLGVTSHQRFGKVGIYSTLAEGGTGTADSGTAMYTTAALTSKPGALIGYMTAPQGTAGQWSAAPTSIFLGSEYPDLDYVANSTSGITPTGDTRYVYITGTGNSVTLDPGTWEVWGQAQHTGTGNVSTEVRVALTAEQPGTASGSLSAASTLPGLTMLAGTEGPIIEAYNANITNLCLNIYALMRTDRTNTVYLNIYTDNTGNSISFAYQIWARRVRLSS